MALATSLEAVKAVEGERQIVAMSVGGEVYGVAIDLVHTVILPQAITVVPRTPEHVRGVINLRGRVVPIVDLRIRFGLPPLPEDRVRHSRIVMVDVGGHHTGVIVDSVSEVLRLPESCIEPPSEYLAPETAYVTAIARAPIVRQGASANANGKAGDAQNAERLILMLDVRKAIQGSEDGLHNQAGTEDSAIAA
jgi:purine-binding chemotaxis protein CheW